MKEFTKKSLDMVATAIGPLVKRRPRRTLFLLFESGELVSGITLLPREWPDGAVTFSLYEQVFWEQIESQICSSFQLKFTRLTIPTYTAFIDFDPILTFSTNAEPELEARRVFDWLVEGGKEELRLATSKAFIVEDQLRSLSRNSRPPVPERAFLVLINNGVAPKQAFEMVSSHLENRNLVERFEGFVFGKSNGRPWEI